MEEKCELKIIYAGIRDLSKNLRNLADKEPLLGFEIKRMTYDLTKFSQDIKMWEELFVKTTIIEPDIFAPSNIIPFPSLGKYSNRHPLSNNRTASLSGFAKPFLAVPGESLPAGVPDYRPLLQRDGLILLAWDKRSTETGDRYTAYWVTSSGIPRFYASKPLCLSDFFTARPDHKSYAAEDGIDFYGQCAPVYMVHVAPELMMCNPKHAELRQAHIEGIKRMGSKVNFNYKFLLKTEKRHGLPYNRPNGNDHHQAKA
jgi:hypothetical protein